MKNQLVILLVLWTTLRVAAQDSVQFDTIPTRPHVSAISNFVFQFDNRNERYFDVKGRMNGLKIGLESFKRVRFGFGLYGNNDFYRIKNPRTSDSVYRTAKFNYSTFFTELVLFRNYRLEFSMIGAIGAGTIQLNQYDPSGNVLVFQRLDTLSNIGVRDIGVNGHYKIFPWLGVGMGVGSRIVVRVNDPDLRTAFNNPYVDFKVKLFLGYAYKSIFKPEAIAKEKAYYDYRKQQRLAKLKTKFDL